MELMCRICREDVEQAPPLDQQPWMPRDRKNYRHTFRRTALCTESGIDAHGKPSPIPSLPVYRKG